MTELLAPVKSNPYCCDPMPSVLKLVCGAPNVGDQLLAVTLDSVGTGELKLRLNVNPSRPVFAHVKLPAKSTSTLTMPVPASVIFTVPKLLPVCGEQAELVLQSVNLKINLVGVGRRA